MVILLKWQGVMRTGKKKYEQRGWNPEGRKLIEERGSTRIGGHQIGREAGSHEERGQRY